MRRNGIYILGIGLILVLVSLFWRNVWIGMQPPTDEQLMQNRETSYDVAIAFTTALRRNEPLAYELAEPYLWPRIDEWMSQNEPKYCVQIYEEVSAVFSDLDPETLMPISHSVIQGCSLEHNEGRYFIKVKDIVINDEGKLISDWGIVEK